MYVSQLNVFQTWCLLALGLLVISVRLNNVLPALTISVKKWRCCLPSCWTCLTKGDSYPGMQRASPAAITEGARLLGPFLSRNPHWAPPKGVLLIPGYKSHWRQNCSLALLCFHQEEKKKSRFMGPEGGAKNVCVCVCLCIIYKYAHIYRHTFMYIHTYRMIPALGCWDHTWEREVYPPAP